MRDGENTDLAFSDNYVLRISIFDIEFVVDSDFIAFITNLVDIKLTSFYESVTERRRLLLNEDGSIQTAQYRLSIEEAQQYQQHGVEFPVSLQSAINTVSEENDKEIIDEFSDRLNDDYDDFKGIL